MKFLLEIYEQEKDWQKAIETSSKLDSVAGHSSAREIAHFYCEMAQAEMVHGRTEPARGNLENALSVNRRCVRAHILLGRPCACRRATRRRRSRLGSGSKRRIRRI